MQPNRRAGSERARPGQVVRHPISRRALSTVTVAVLATGLSACGDSPDAPGGPRFDSAESVWLLDELQFAQVRSPDLAALSGQRTDDSAAVVFRDELDTTPPRGWVSGVARDGEPVAPAARVRAVADPLVTGALDPPPSCLYVPLQSKGLFREVEVPPGTACLIRARVWAANAATAPSSGIWVEWVAGDSAGEDGNQRRAIEQGRLRAALVAEQAGEWQILELFAAPKPGRHALRLTLLGGAGGTLFDWVEVRALSLAEAFGSARRSVPRTPELALRSTQRGAREIHDCLVLTPSSQMSIRLEVPKRNPRWSTEVGLLARVSSASAQLEVTVDGDPVAARPLTASSPASDPEFEPWTVSLEPYAGTEVDLCVKLSGEAECVALLSSPKLLGAGAGPPPTNLLLISLDTLRADALGCYGFEEPVSPRIDRLAQQGTLFEQTSAPSSFTLPTHATLMTGQHPLVHFAHRGSQRLSVQRSAMLAEQLQAAGYHTAAFTGGGYVHPEFGFGRGFERFGVEDPGGVPLAFQERNAAARERLPDCLQPSLDWIERHRDQPFFVFLHTYLVHNYIAEPETIERFVDGDRDLLEIPRNTLWRRAENGDERAARVLRQIYSATLAQADERVVGRLLDHLKELGLLESTLVVLVSDHGEAFREHEVMGHGQSLHREEVSVPWIVSGPGVPVGRRIETPARLEDVARTVLARLGLPADPRIGGRDMLAEPLRPMSGLALHLDGTEVPGRRDSWVTDSWKLIRALDRGAPAPAFELYQREQDPGELRDIAESNPGQVARLQAELEQRLRAFAEISEGFQTADEQLPEELRRQLEALGYTDPDQH